MPSLSSLETEPSGMKCQTLYLAVVSLNRKLGSDESVLDLSLSLSLSLYLSIYLSLPAHADFTEDLVPSDRKRGAARAATEKAIRARPGSSRKGRSHYDSNGILVRSVPRALRNREAQAPLAERSSMDGKVAGSSPRPSLLPSTHPACFYRDRPGRSLA